MRTKADIRSPQEFLAPAQGMWNTPPSRPGGKSDIKTSYSLSETGGIDHSNRPRFFDAAAAKQPVGQYFA